MAVSKKLLKWRRRRKAGSIMKPSTFARIQRKARGAHDPAAVAGAAYWAAARSKFRKRRRK